MLKGLFRSRASNGFRTRSADRDTDADAALIESVGASIGDALAAFEKERDGLSRRISDAQMLASVTVGTGTDDYVTREPAQAEGLASYEAEMRRGRERLTKLENHISNLKFMRAAFATRFSEFNRKELQKLQDERRHGPEAP
jgi:hypothetical protein